MAENKNNEKSTDKNLVWTCSECGGHYLIMPVIVGQEYSVDNETGQEFWGEIEDADSQYIFEEKDGETHAFCKTCGKETLCRLEPFKPSKIPAPNLLKDAEKVNDANLKSVNSPPDDIIV